MPVNNEIYLSHILVPSNQTALTHSKGARQRMLLSSGDTGCHVKSNTKVYCESLSYHTSMCAHLGEIIQRDGAVQEIGSKERACPMEARSLSFFLDSVKMMPLLIGQERSPGSWFLCCSIPSDFPTHCYPSSQLLIRIRVGRFPASSSESTSLEVQPAQRCSGECCHSLTFSRISYVGYFLV